jgi:hypothetical protein
MTTITYTVYSAELTDEAIPADELRDSAENLAAEVEADIRAEYPEATITTNVEHNVTGVGSGIRVDHDGGGEQELAIRDVCASIAERAFDRGSFWV